MSLSAGPPGTRWHEGGRCYGSVPGGTRGGMPANSAERYVSSRAARRLQRAARDRLDMEPSRHGGPFSRGATASGGHCSDTLARQGRHQRARRAIPRTPRGTASNLMAW